MKMYTAPPAQEEADLEALLDRFRASTDCGAADRGSGQTGDLERLLEAAQNEGDLASSGCVFYVLPMRTDWTDTRRVTLIQEIPVQARLTELFIGQLTYRLSPSSIALLVQVLAGAPIPIVRRVQLGKTRNTAFIQVLRAWVPALLSLDRRAICDICGVWVAPPGNHAAADAIASEALRRHAQKIKLLPAGALGIEPTRPRQPRPDPEQHPAKGHPLIMPDRAPRPIGQPPGYWAAVRGPLFATPPH